jgi:hypothetical protein
LGKIKVLSIGLSLEAQGVLQYCGVKVKKFFTIEVIVLAPRSILGVSIVV